MINMMYLVLTALLALNVSKEILDSFITVNNGLENTKGTLAEKMDATYQQFGSLAGQNQEKYGAAFAKAQQVQRDAASLVTYIDSVKVKAISTAEKWPVERIIGKDAAGHDTLVNLSLLSKKDSHDELTNMLVGSEPAKPKEGPMSATELRQKLEAFRDLVKQRAADDPKLVASADMIFNFDDRKDASGTMNNWQSINFYHVPLVAGVTILSKIQSDVRNLENELVTKLMGDVEKSSFKFNTLEAIVKPRSSYVTVGSKYSAEIFLGAYDDQNAPEVWICKPGARVDTTSKPAKIIGDSEKLPMSGAKAVLERVAGGAGLQTVSGIIKFKPVGGQEQIQPFFTEYEVAAPNLVVSPTKMNVFYRGVDNPVSISVSGYSDKDIQPSTTNGELKKGGEGYIFRPGKDAKSTIGATVKNPDGSSKSMPGIEFRVKNVPNPSPYFAGKSLSDNSAKKSELTAAQGVIAKMENFEFDLKFEVVEYTVSATLSGNVVERQVKGAALSSDAKEIISKVKTGQKISFENIKARGPDGTTRPIGTLVFKVN